MYKNNAQTISKAAEKMKNNQLLIEDVLDEEDLVNDLKSPSFSQLISFLNTEKMEKLLDYILKEPPQDSDQKVGHKFPYYACEILCSENVFLLEKYFEDVNKQEDNREGDDHSLDHHEENLDGVEKSDQVNLKEKYFDEGKEETSEKKPEDEEIQ